MKVRHFTLAALLTVIVAVPASAQSSAYKSDSLARARQITQWFYLQQFDSLFWNSDAESRKEMKSAAAYEDALSQLRSRAGVEESVIEEKFVKRNGNTQYWRTAKFSTAPEPMLIRWAFNTRGELTGIGMGPLSQAPPVDPAS